MSKLLLKKLGKEQYIKNSKGDVEFIVLSLTEYNKIIEMLEDYGLALAMKEAENDKNFSKEEALRYLNND